MQLRRWIVYLIFMLVPFTLQAAQVEVVAVEMEQAGASWTIRVTLRHADAGWDHYADAWRLVDASGKVLGTRVLHHPHVNEQPFTRSLSGVQIPGKLTKVYVEAHDKVHGWSKDRVKVDMQTDKGKRYQLKR